MQSSAREEQSLPAEVETVSKWATSRLETIHRLLCEQGSGSCDALGVTQGLGLGGEAAAVAALMGEVLNLRIAHVSRVVGVDAAILADMGFGGLEGTTEMSTGCSRSAAGRADSRFALVFVQLTLRDVAV